LSKKTTTTLGILIHSMYRQQQKHIIISVKGTPPIFTKKKSTGLVFVTSLATDKSPTLMIN